MSLTMTSGTFDFNSQKRRNTTEEVLRSKQMELTSKNQVWHQDVFLNMTTFLSVHELCTLQRVCKSFYSWLSDPNTFSWKQRGRSAFPLSCQIVLQQPVKEQYQQLSKFDSLINAGHQVSFYSLDNLTSVSIKRSWWEDSEEKPPKSYQLPWDKDSFVLTRVIVKNNDGDSAHNQWSIVLFNSTTRCASTPVELPWQPGTFLFDIKNQKIGVARVKSRFGSYNLDEDIKIYRSHLGELVHERNVRIPRNVYRVLPQMFGDYVIFKSTTDHDEYKYSLYSITSNAPVDAISIHGESVLEQMSITDPVFFTCTLDNDITKITCKGDQLIATDLPSNKLRVDQDDDGHGVQSIELIEQGRSKFLRIYQSGCADSAVEIYAVNRQECIFSQYAGGNQEHNLKKSDDYYGEAWKNLQINIGTPCYSTTSGEYGVVTIGNLSSPFNDFIDTKEPIQDNNRAIRFIFSATDAYPDAPSYFSKYYENCVAINSQWLNSDILTFKVGPNRRKSGSAHRQMFVSVSKGSEIGWIEDDIEAMFVNGNKVVAFNAQNQVYEIKFDLSYVVPNTYEKKRKLAESAKDKRANKKMRK